VISVSEMLEASLMYAERGWPVIPLHSVSDGVCTCRKGARCGSPGKHPRVGNWQRASSTVPGTIRHWFERWPSSNIGIVTGTPSGVLVIDVDDKADRRGSIALDCLKEELGWITETLTAMTGSGRHLFYRQPAAKCVNSTSSLGDGLDVRTDGGYVVAAPSLHVTGKRYAWADFEHEIEELPAEIIQLLRGSPRIDSAMVQKSGSIPEGMRNNALTSLAGRMWARGMTQVAIAGALAEFNAAKCIPPLPNTELLGIAQSICRYPAGTALSGAHLPWFPFYAGDWFRSVQGFDDSQRGQYMNLLAYCWDKGGYLPADPDRLWRIAGAKSKEAFVNAGSDEMVLSEFTQVVSDEKPVLFHPRMAELFQEQLKKYKQKCEASAKAAEHRIKSKGGQPIPSIPDGEEQSIGE